MVEFFNYLATVNTALGSAVSFYIGCGLNASMILLEGIEIRRTRLHGGKQTPWDRFFFGQVRLGAAPNPETQNAHAVQSTLTDPRVPTCGGAVARRDAQELLRQVQRAHDARRAFLLQRLYGACGPPTQQRPPRHRRHGHFARE